MLPAINKLSNITIKRNTTTAKLVRRSNGLRAIGKAPAGRTTEQATATFPQKLKATNAKQTTTAVKHKQLYVLPKSGRDAVIKQLATDIDTPIMKAES